MDKIKRIWNGCYVRLFISFILNSFKIFNYSCGALSLKCGLVLSDLLIPQIYSINNSLSESFLFAALLAFIGLIGTIVVVFIDSLNE